MTTNPGIKPTVCPAWYVFWDQHLAKSSLKKPERLCPATDRSKWWAPQPNMRWRMGSPAQGEGSEGSVTPQDHHPQNRSTGTLGDSKEIRDLVGESCPGERNQRGQQHSKINTHRINQLGLLGTQRDQGPCRELPWVLCVYIMKELLSILLGFQTVRVWTVSDSFACCGTFFLLLGWLMEPWNDGMCLVLLWLLTLFGWCPSEIFSLHRRIRWLDLKERELGEKIEGRGGRGNCGMEVMYERRIKIKEEREMLQINK